MKLVLSFLFAISFNAFADQCAWNTRTDAASAAKLLTDNDIILWCQNCGEVKPSTIQKVLSVQETRPADNYREITVKTEKYVDTIDLAYTYVRTASNIFTNMAHLVGCPSEGATSFIQTGPGLKKTAHYYDAKGVRVNVASTSEEVAFQNYKMKSDRLPASKK